MDPWNLLAYLVSLWPTGDPVERREGGKGREGKGKKGEGREGKKREGKGKNERFLRKDI